MKTSYSKREKWLVGIILALVILQLLGYFSTKNRAEERRVEVEREQYYSEHGEFPKQRY